MPAYRLFASRCPTWSRSFLPPSGLMTADAKSSVTVPTATRPGYDSTDFPIQRASSAYDRPRCRMEYDPTSSSSSRSTTQPL